MIDLLNNIKAFLGTAIDTKKINAKRVELGLHADLQKIPVPAFPYITLDDGGERTEESGTEDTLWRYYSVIVEFGVFHTNKDIALSNMLALSNEVKAIFTKETNRQLDDMEWGVHIEPITWADEKYFYRGRTVTIVYKNLEDTYDERY